MQLGMVGLGRMGSNLVRRLLPAGHEWVVYDLDADTVKELAGEDATGSARRTSWSSSSNRPARSG